MSSAQHPLAQALHAAFETHRDAVLTAPPGAGKSTIVPLALLEEPWLAGRRILMLEPRRLAARAVAQRMASTLGEPVGERVGYRMRQDTRVSRRTRIEVITEGVLTRLLQSDPALEGVGCVIFDEYHERSLQADLGLALCLDARAQLDAPFRILVMSATIDGAQVARLLDDAPVVSVPGRSYPVDMIYAGKGSPPLPLAFGAARGAESPERSLAALVRRALGETEGDLLVFLPGAGEIRRVQNLLQEGLDANTRILPLYGELGGDAQDAVLQPLPGVRKLILATNIAETSLTIAGVTVVVDSGLVRRARFDPASGMSRLEVMRVARASADQRAGRAGRTAPGRCYRLWSEGSHATLAAQTPAEILETDLAPLALELANWGAADGSTLRWLDAPPDAMLAQARDLLQRLGALDAQGRMTSTGRAMVRLPLHPRLAHMLVHAREQGGLRLAAELAALLSERDLLRGGGFERDADVRTRLEVLRRESGLDVDRNALARVRRNAEQLQRQAGESGDRGANTRVAARAPAAGVDEPSVGALLAQAFPDRIGQRRGESGGRYLLANGRGAAFASQQSLARSEFIVAIELDDKDREARIDLAAPLDRADIEAGFADEVAAQASVHWDAQTEAVSARRVRRLGALVLEDKPLQNVASEAMGAALLEGVRALGIHALPWERDSRNLRARLQFVRALKRKDLADWPASDDASLLASLEDWLPPWIEGMSRREHLARLPLNDALLARLSHAQRRQLEELAPREIVVPTGSHVRVDYEDDNAPCIEVRLQEVFGLASTPRIGGGEVPITFKLLSPARRPVQITRDLAGFWHGSYFDVRKDMRGRYPRHYWPENPLEAEPTRGIKRR
ncbi:MAG: ATP-dependent helicase HrpB [Steroidobacteraceae bacterium]